VTIKRKIVGVYAINLADVQGFAEKIKETMSQDFPLPVRALCKKCVLVESLLLTNVCVWDLGVGGGE
jgi:hypothetical protein